MAAGDSGRRWFSEMVDVLRDQWHPALSCEELIALAKRLDMMIRQIRQERGIKTPTMYCRRCGVRHEQVFRISVRAMILATARFEMASDEEAKLVEKRWAKYRTEHGLDLHGDQSSDNPSANRQKVPQMKLAQHHSQVQV